MSLSSLVLSQFRIKNEKKTELVSQDICIQEVPRMTRVFYLWT